MGSYESGVHGETDHGAIDLGLTVTDDGLGVALDAPGIGQLRVAFDLLKDGTTKLTSLSREGLPVLGLTDHARLAELEAQLDATRAALAAAEARTQELERTLEQHDAEAQRRLEQAHSALGATQASLEQTDARQHQAHDELQRTKRSLEQTEAQLRRTQADLTASRLQFTEVDVKLRTALTELTAAKATRAELAATKKSLTEAEGRLRRLQTKADLDRDELGAKAEAAAAELVDVSTRLTQADELRATQDALLEQSRAELLRTLEEKEALTAERDEATKKLQAAEATHGSEIERLGAELADTRIAQAEAAAADQAIAQDELQKMVDALDAEKARSVGLDVELTDLRQQVKRQKADLDEERARRDEMVRDLAFIQTQVSDLSSTKGALVARITQMSDREKRRLRTTSEMTDVLRTAEVVAADTKASARRFEAKATKLEDQVRGMSQEILELRGRAEVSENSVLMLGEQLTRVTKERDALKVDVGFFQKQIGALQRAAADAQRKPPKK